MGCARRGRVRRRGSRRFGRGGRSGCENFGDVAPRLVEGRVCGGDGGGEDDRGGAGIVAVYSGLKATSLALRRRRRG